MKDLLNDDLPPSGLHRNYPTSPNARASALPGPRSETCGSCVHSIYNVRGGTKRYYKCGIARRKATHGSGTDIKLKDPACARWEKIQ